MRFILIAAIAVVVGCSSVPPRQLEDIRAFGQYLRERAPGTPVGGAGSLADAKALAATGESEEIDYWQLDVMPTANEYAALRAVFDGAGGRAVQILKPGEKYRPLDTAQTLSIKGEMSGEVLATGTDRVFRVDPRGHVAWEKRGCGNVHCAYAHGDFIYYSNGAIYRVPRTCGPWTNPERIWASEVNMGGGALCFDLTPEGTLVIGVNSTCEVVEMDVRSRRELAHFAVDAGNSSGEMPPPHGRVRCVRKTSKGTYLVACAGAETVREFNCVGQIVWSVKAPAFVFDVVRRPNGNTLVSHVTGITEYSYKGDVVWTLTPTDIPGLNAANFTALQLRKNGNLVVGTWANGANLSTAAAFEVTPEKKVVWSLSSPTDVNMMSVRVL